MGSPSNDPEIPRHQLERRLVISSHHAGYVVDASVLVKWFLHEQEGDRDRALALRDLHISGRSTIYVPQLALLDVLNALRFRPKAKEEDAIELFKYAVDSGINLIDTADVYGLGRNETLIGKALSKEQKENILIATKAGLSRPGGTAWHTYGMPDHIR